MMIKLLTMMSHTGNEWLIQVCKVNVQLYTMSVADAHHFAAFSEM